jgi:hypothetical protein
MPRQKKQRKVLGMTEHELALKKQREELLSIMERLVDKAWANGKADALRWRPIETAPKDGSAILLLSAAYEDELGVHPARVAIGHWHAEGTSWVDEMGRLDGDSYTLAVTGVWFSGGGWFQPNEVTHWQLLPEGLAHV